MSPGDAGRVVYGVAIAGLGALSLFTGDFASVWQPVPEWVPWPHALAHASGAVLIVGGVGVLWDKSAVRASLALTVYVALWLLLLHVPRIVARPDHEVTWSGFGEIATLAAAAWILFATRSPTGPLGGDRGVRLARALFAVGIPLVGLSHFVYVAATAEMVPAWLPGRVGWAYATGAGHIATGLAILLGVLPRLATTLEAVMVSSFVLTIHLPSVVGAPTDKLQWTMFFIASAIAGASWVVAGSYAERFTPPPLAPRPAGARYPRALGQGGGPRGVG